MFINYITENYVGPLANFIFLLRESFFGFDLVFRYIWDSYRNDPFRILLEGFLVFFAIKYILHKSYKPNSKEFDLTEQVC